MELSENKQTWEIYQRKDGVLMQENDSRSKVRSRDYVISSIFYDKNFRALKFWTQTEMKSAGKFS